MALAVKIYMHEIKGMAETFYGDLFSSEPCDSEVVLDSIQAKVTNEMNAELSKAYTDLEIKTTLFQIGPTKDPGPDSFSSSLLPDTLGVAER
jgi:hypothetical protein